MELKYKNKNGCFPSFGNNFLTLFGLMVLDDEDRKLREENLETPDDSVIEKDNIFDECDDIDNEPE